MKIEFTGPAFAVVKEIEEFVAAWRQDQALPIAPEAFSAALDATTGDAEPAPKKRGRPKKQPVEQQHAPEVAPLSPNAELMTEAVVAEMEQATEPNDTPDDKSLAVPDLDAIKAAFRSYANAHGIEAASALLAEFGVNKPSELATDELKVEFYQRVSA